MTRRWQPDAERRTPVVPTRAQCYEYGEGCDTASRRLLSLRRASRRLWPRRIHKISNIVKRKSERHTFPVDRRRASRCLARRASRRPGSRCRESRCLVSRRRNKIPNITKMSTMLATRSRASRGLLSRLWWHKFPKKWRALGRYRMWRWHPNAERRES